MNDRSFLPDGAGFVFAAVIGLAFWAAVAFVWWAL